MIDARAIIDPKASIAQDVTIGPWSIIGPEVEIGNGSVIDSHVVIKGPTRMGCNNHIYKFCSIGENPQDKKYQGEKTYLEIGHRNTIREFCTIHRGTVQGDLVTRIGNDNLFMAYVHIAHDCVVGNHATFSNYAAIAGHVSVQDYAIFSGYAGAHQYSQIGRHSFLGLGTLVRKDVLPYVLVDGSEAAVRGLNLEGLKRAKFSEQKIACLKRAYRIIYRQGLTVTQAVIELYKLKEECSDVDYLIKALESSKRGIVR